MNKGILYLVCPPVLFVTTLWLLQGSAATVGVYLLTIVLFLFFTRGEERKQSFSKTSVLLTFFATAILVAVSFFLTEKQEVTRQTAATIIIFAPIAEEIVFRELSFKRSNFHPVVAAIISTALFAVAHGLAIDTIVVSAVAGLTLCALYYKTGNLSFTIAAHIFANAIISLI